VNPGSLTRILVADDEPSYRMSLAMVLNATGLYEVDEATSGEEAIDALNQREYDLVILDHQMGEVSGLNVMQWIFEQKLQIPVIILTASGSDTIAVEMMKLGAYDYVRKDQIELDRFPVLINATLQGFTSRMQRQQTSNPPNHPLRNNDVVGLLENTSASFSRSAEAVIGLIADEFDEYRKRVRPNLDPSSRSDVDRIMKNFQEQLKLVSLFTKTLSDLALIARTRRDSNLLPNEGGNAIRRSTGWIDDSNLEVD
jgi:DNA-binding response OmpR family regulator